MRLEVVTVADCPNGPVLEDRLVTALAGRPDCEVTRHVVADEAEAARRGMHGSPTLLIDGSDPFATAGTPTSFACRLYRSADGATDGAPSVEDLRQALAGADLASLAQPAGRAGRGRLAPTERGLRAVQQTVLRSFATTGNAPTAAELDHAAQPFGRPAADILAELAAEDFLTLDHSGRILAAYPFSAAPTEHVVQIASGPRVFSMCAIDALGIPVMLGADAVITSTDPVNGAPVRVEFAGGTTTWQPGTAVVYYGARDQDGPAASVCCDYLRFFTDRTTAEQWAGQQAGLSGAVVGKAEAERLGADIFGHLLTAPARARTGDCCGGAL
ncbi:alkylmercury lyase family protein [Streptomyces sp. H34-S4]|uniref:alkylmercury lyase family protein n=1 Tax=Streptomyces sp. H34-S4 TaxID=2996463 RepID=UPI00227121A8|nr:alkylmercury lyase family protein [Streptomyces sp. H34-S4]MCY0937505.1 alkylmercury lyase family protein [Streptomyces sp. H34-S4]